LVSLYHDEEAANAAQEEFDRIFVKKDLPDEVPEMSIDTENGSVSIIRLLTETKLATSNGEARRLIGQGGITVDGKRVDDDKATIEIHDAVIVKVGKRKFLRVKKT
jgi:tyrosyl-tRNA synthetase